jgi:CRISPR-associated protein Cas2
MRYVIAYDVSDDKIRLAIAEVLEGFGTRVQKSVFECELVGDGLEVLTGMLRLALESPKNGQVRFYSLCSDCFDVAFGIGEVEAVGAEPAIAA